MHETAHPVKTVEVTVTFPLSTREPYRHKAHETEMIGQIREHAMHHFHVQEEPGSEYYLTNDANHDSRLPDSDTVHDVAAEKDVLELTLVKDLVQG